MKCYMFRIIAFIWIFRFGSNTITALAGPAQKKLKVHIDCPNKNITNFFKIHNASDFESVRDFISNLLELTGNRGLYLTSENSKKFLQLWSKLASQETGQINTCQNKHSTSLLKDEAYTCKLKSLGSFSVHMVNNVWRAKPYVSPGGPGAAREEVPEDMLGVFDSIKSPSTLQEFINNRISTINFRNISTCALIPKREIRKRECLPVTEIYFNAFGKSILLCDPASYMTIAQCVNRYATPKNTENVLL